MDNIENWIDALLISSGVSESIAIYLRLFILLVLLVLIAGTAYLITKKVIIHYIYKFVRKSPVKWDDLLAEKRVFDHVAHIIPAIIVRIMAPAIFSDFSQLLPVIEKLTDSYLVIVGMAIVFAFLKAAEYWLSSLPAFSNKPLVSYFQLIRIILYVITGILVLSVLLDQTPVYFLSAFGAMTAILLLIFQNTILGLVASVQLSANDSIRIGDWVEIPKFNADGDVIEINLNNVKVQNWDKTITTIPTYHFNSDSFKNWRGMQQSGGRRIKRSIFIDVQSIKFVDPEMREKFKKNHLIRDYVTNRQQEIETFNREFEIDTSVLINGRRMTNIGVFRTYIESYLKSHPKVKQDMSIMVRQLAADNQGIPMEIYCFTDTIKWAEYEGIQSDIFDHLYSAAGFFDVKIFQSPSGMDLSRLKEPVAKVTG